jgi:hypothetical protein
MTAPCDAGVGNSITWIARLVMELPYPRMPEDLKCADPEEFDQRSR